jgi:hypothetical protein
MNQSSLPSGMQIPSALGRSLGVTHNHQPTHSRAALFQRSYEGHPSLPATLLKKQKHPTGTPESNALERTQEEQNIALSFELFNQLQKGSPADLKSGIRRAGSARITDLWK